MEKDRCAAQSYCSRSTIGPTLIIQRIEAETVDNEALC